MHAYKSAGGLPEVFQDKDMAYLVIHNNKVYNTHTINGFELVCTETKSGVDINFKMKKGFRFKKPINICFGIIPEQGKQEINIKGVIEDYAELEFLAYCVFPNAVKIQHIMFGDIKIGNNSSFKYSEVHYHGNNGGIEVNPTLKLTMGENSYYKGIFSLTKGKAGKINIDYDTNAGRNSKIELIAKVLASGDDNVNVKEKITLEEENAKGLIESKMVGRNNSKTNVLSELIALKPGCVGHVDCIETIIDNATAKATPLIDVQDKDAKVTHEAAIGRLNSEQLEVLQTKGLDENAATETLIYNLLR